MQAVNCTLNDYPWYEREFTYIHLLDFLFISLRLIDTDSGWWFEAVL
jgi:hypothetical protein